MTASAQDRAAPAPRWLWPAVAAVVVVGTVARFVLAWRVTADPGDVAASLAVSAQLVHHPLHAYATPVWRAPFGTQYAWPYPAGYFPVLAAGRLLLSLTGASPRLVFAVPNVLADAALAAFAAWWALRRGSAPRAVVLAAATLALGPLLLVVTGAMSQIDSVTVLPAVLAVAAWALGVRRREVVAGLLLGLAVSLKTVPVFLLLALLPTARDRREGLRLAALTAAVPLVLTGPFLLADPQHSLRALLGNRGLPGLGGISLFVDPGFAHAWLSRSLVAPSRVGAWLHGWQQVIVLAAVGAVGALLWRRRVDCVRGAALVWLAVWVANIDFNFTYLAWGLPFLVLAGWLDAAWVLQAAFLVPAVQLYFLGEHPLGDRLYLPLMAVGYALLVAAAVVGVRRVAGRLPRPGYVAVANAGAPAP